MMSLDELATQPLQLSSRRSYYLCAHQNFVNAPKVTSSTMVSILRNRAYQINIPVFSTLENIMHAMQLREGERWQRDRVVNRVQVENLSVCPSPHFINHNRLRSTKTTPTSVSLNTGLTKVNGNVLSHFCCRWRRENSKQMRRMIGDYQDAFGCVSSFNKVEDSHNQNVIISNQLSWPSFLPMGGFSTYQN